MQEVVEFLESMLRQGYCLHGSPIKIEGCIEPKQAHCDSGRPEGCLKALYATRDDLRPACLRALFSKLDPFRDSYSSYSGESDGLLTVKGENTTFRPGYVYVLPTSTFVESGEEYISFEPVLPHLVVRVTPDILHLLPNLDLRIPVPTSW